MIIQATPRLRQALCQAGNCDSNGVPVSLPRLQQFQRPAAQP